MVDCFFVQTSEIPRLSQPVLLDQQLAYDPYLTCTPSFPCGPLGAINLIRAPGSPTNRENRLTPRDLILAFAISCSPQPAARYRPLRSLTTLGSRVSPAQLYNLCDLHRISAPETDVSSTGGYRRNRFARTVALAWRQAPSLLTTINITEDRVCCRLPPQFGVGELA